MANVQKFPKTEELLEIMFEVPSTDGKAEGYLLDKRTGSSRWMEQRRVVFRYKDKIWQAHYDVGLTEMQETCPFEYDDEIECTEVEPYEKVVTSIDYRPVT